MSTDPSQPMPAEPSDDALSREAVNQPEPATGPAPTEDSTSQTKSPNQADSPVMVEPAASPGAAEARPEPTAETGPDTSAVPGTALPDTTADAENGPRRRKIQIGSRRPGASGSQRRVRPAQGGTGVAAAEQRKTAREASRQRSELTEGPSGTDDDPLAAAIDTAMKGVSRAPTRVSPPSRRDPLSAELQAEFEAMLGDVSMEELVSGDQAKSPGEPLEIDARTVGIVEKVHGDDVFFLLEGRNPGVASLRQFDEPPAIGSRHEVIVRGFQPDDGLYELSVPGASIDVSGWEDLIEGAVVEATVTGSNAGGLECLVGSVRGFIPASQVEVFRVDNFEEYVDQKLQCVVTEANESRRNLVLSHRAVVERQREEARRQLLEELEPGQVREGVVTSIRDFGAFVDLGGVDGLIHISKLSWERVEHPSDVLEVGQKVRVKVENVDEQTGKIGLSYRDLLEHPWTNVEARFPPTTHVKGVVTRTAKFGAFVRIAPGVEGLVHISELAHHRVVQVTNVVKEGDVVDVVVLSVDEEAQRISLSLKAAHPIPEAAQDDEPEKQAVEEPPPKPIVPKRQGPLKGGTGRNAGGEQFGLKW